jgi:hypothetical protein
MIKDAKHAEKELGKLPRPDAVLTFVPRVDLGVEHPDQPVPKLTFKHPAIFPKNEPQGATHGLYIPGKIPANKFEMEQMQREWAVIKSNANAKEVVLDEWPMSETPIVVQLQGRMGVDGEIVQRNFIPVDMNNVIAWAYLTPEGQMVHHPGRFRQPHLLFVDCEFDDTTKTLLSVGIVSKTGTVYYAFDSKAASAVEYEWVKENVVPLLLDVPPGTSVTDLNAQGTDWATWLESVMRLESNSHDTIYEPFEIHVDFPTDVEYISRILHLGEGRRIGMMRELTFKIDYVDAYPTILKQAVQHNAAWDALAIWVHLGYLSYRVMAEIQHAAKTGTPSSRETLPEKQKLPPLVEAMLQQALQKK